MHSLKFLPHFFSQQRSKPEEEVDRAGGRGLDIDLRQQRRGLGGAGEADPVGRGRGEAAEVDAESAGN